MPRIVYSRRYNISFFGLERLHPFDSRKYGRAWRRLRAHFGSRLRSWQAAPKRQASREDLLLVHTPDYLSKLGNADYVARALELPQVRRLPGWMIDRRVLRPMRWATAGTVVAAREALAHGFAVNLSGGYHHAKPDRGEGFSIYADVGIAVASLRAQGLIADEDRVVYIDTDAHQGNGVCHTFMDDARVYVLDVFNENIYPNYDIAARDRIDCPVPVNSAYADDQYQRELRARLPGFLDSVGKSKIGIAFYNAGTDVVAGDPVGGLNISARAICDRDSYVISELRKRGIPSVMVLSGGYTRNSYEIVADSVIRLIEAEPNC